MYGGAPGAPITVQGQRRTCDFNITTDQAITIPNGGRSYVIRRVVVSNASASLTLAAGGIYTATSKGGSAVVAAAQVYSAVTGTTKFVDATLAAVATTDLQTVGTLYLSLTVAQGGAATADVTILVDLL